MPDVMVQQDATISASFRDQAGPITTATVTITIYDRATGSVVVGPTAATHNPTLPGTYEYLLSSANTLTPKRLRAVFKGQTPGGVDVYREVYLSIGYRREGALTKRELRNLVARTVWGDQKVWELTVDDAVFNSVSAAHLPELVLGGAGEWRGSYLRFLDRGNAGLDRRIISWDDATFVATYLDAAVQVIGGDRVDLLPIAPSSIDDCIGQALQGLGLGDWSEAEEQLATTDGTTTDFDLPADAVFVHRVALYSAATGYYIDEFEPSAWRVRPGNKLEVRGVAVVDTPLGTYPASGALPSGYTLRILMGVQPNLPLYDDSYVDVNPVYVQYKACELLALRLPGQERRAAYFAQQAEAWRSRVRRSLPTNYQAVSR